MWRSASGKEKAGLRSAGPRFLLQVERPRAHSPNMLRRAYVAAQDFAFGGAVCGIGDIAAQLLGTSTASFELDAHRTAIVSAYGATVCAPYHLWYKFLAWRFPGQSARAVACKTASELLIALPVFEVPAFSLWTGALEKRLSLDDNIAKARSQWLSAVVAGWGIWGPASLATFAVFADPRNQLRVLYCAGSAWACTISWLSFREHEAAHVDGSRPAAGAPR